MIPQILLTIRTIVPYLAYVKIATDYFNNNTTTQNVPIVNQSSYCDVGTLLGVLNTGVGVVSSVKSLVGTSRLDKLEQAISEGLKKVDNEIYLLRKDTSQGIQNIKYETRLELDRERFVNKLIRICVSMVERYELIFPDYVRELREIKWTIMISGDKVEPLLKVYDCLTTGPILVEDGVNHFIN
jgi:hypothetical protein